MAIDIHSRTRVFPESHTQSARPKIEPLSVVDATVLNFATSGCVLFYSHTLDVKRLLTSLKKTLDAYPHWAGQLQFVNYKPDAGHRHRQGRLELSYGSGSDPGIECIIARADSPMSSTIPPAAALKIWDATSIDYQAFLDMDTPFGLNGAKEPKGVPSMKVQFTSFTSAGTAVAIGLMHPLADAQTLLHFTHDWAAINRALSASSSPPMIRPVFNPSLLDAAAAGNIDAPNPDPTISTRAGNLPLHRYDYWVSATSACPEWALPACEIPPELNLSESELQKGPQIPWDTWDTGAPVSHTNFFFTAAETEAIYLHAVANTPTKISHQDALLAHIWAALIRARGSKEGKKHYLDVSVDVRRRLNPPLPSAFIGSPIINAACASTASTSTAVEDLSRDVGSKAASIRHTIQQFGADNMAALLHEMAFELGSQRRWNCFLGDEHVIATSWVGIGFRDVVFEEGVRSSWAEALLPSCEGVVQVMEGCGVCEDGGKGEREDGAKEWWGNGVTLSIWLRSDVMGKLVKDKELRAFARRRIS